MNGREIYGGVPDVGYSTDMAAEIDSPADCLAEELGVSLAVAVRVQAWHAKRLDLEIRTAQAEQLGRIVGVLVRPVRNLKALVRGLALSAGLDELNGTHSQAEVARELGCTRALMSHYVTMWADLLGVHVLKFRKAPGCRATYSKAASAAWRKRKGNV